MTKPADIVFSRTMNNAPTFKRVTEVDVSYPFRPEPSDVVLRVLYEDGYDEQDQPKWTEDPPGSFYTTPDKIVVRREVDLTDEEAALVQAGINYGYSSRSGVLTTSGAYGTAQ